MTISDVIAKLRDQGVSLTADGSKLRWNAPDAWPTPERMEFLRVHKALILAYLNDTQKRDNSESQRDRSKLGGSIRLELALDVLARLIPDDTKRQRIKAMAEADAHNWRFLGTDSYRQVLANNIIEAVEKSCGELVWFAGPDEDGRFTDGFLAEKKHRCGNIGINGLKTGQVNVLMGPLQHVGNRTNKLPIFQCVLFKEQQ